MAPEACALCTRPGAIFCQTCAEYNENNVLMNAQWYCSLLCKAADETNHKHDCRQESASVQYDLLALAKRAGEIAQALFYTFICCTWAYDMANVHIVHNQHDELVAIEVAAGAGVQTGPGKESTCERHAGGWLIQFPHETISSRDHHALHAILADRNSIWAIVCMHAVVQVLFQDLVEDVEQDVKEVIHYLPIYARRLVSYKGRFGLGTYERDDLPYPDHDATGNVKGVFQITLKDGTMIALDLAGAQFNLSHATVMPWATYRIQCMDRIKYRVPFRSHYKKHAECMSSYRCVTHLTLIMEQLIYFNVFISHSGGELDFELKDILGMNEEDFYAAKTQVPKQATEYLQRRIADLDSGSSPNSMLNTFDMRHPDLIAKLPKPVETEAVLHDLGDMKKFNWEMLRKLIRMPHGMVRLREKQRLRQLLDNRCVYKMVGNWRLIFLKDALPSRKVADECVSENPRWGRT